MDIDYCGHETVFLHRFGIGAAPIGASAGRQSAALDHGTALPERLFWLRTVCPGRESQMTDTSQANDTMQRDANGSGSASSEGTTADKFKSQFATFKSQAGDKARDYAGQGVTRATDALDEAARFLEDTARTVEEKLGPQYGRYGFSAAESVAGFASQLRGKDVDQLVDDVRDLVRKSPAVAIGAAVGLGFVLARLAKAGAGYESANAGDGSPARSGDRPASPATVTGGSPSIETASGGTGGLGGTTDAAKDGSPITPTFPA
jgi:hypothetical protein